MPKPMEFTQRTCGALACAALSLACACAQAEELDAAARHTLARELLRHAAARVDVKSCEGTRWPTVADYVAYALPFGREERPELHAVTLDCAERDGATRQCQLNFAYRSRNAPEGGYNRLLRFEANAKSLRIAPKSFLCVDVP